MMPAQGLSITGEASHRHQSTVDESQMLSHSKDMDAISPSARHRASVTVGRPLSDHPEPDQTAPSGSAIGVKVPRDIPVRHDDLQGNIGVSVYSRTKAVGGQASVRSKKYCIFATACKPTDGMPDVPGHRIWTVGGTDCREVVA